MNPWKLTLVFMLLLAVSLPIAAGQAADSASQIKVGDTAKYTLTATWQSSQSTTEKPAIITEMQNIKSITVTVDSVSESFINYTATLQFTNGTSQKVAQSTSFDTFFVVVQPGQTLADALGIPKQTVTSIDVVNRTYGGAERVVDQVKYLVAVGTDYGVSATGYWDNQTGLATEQSMSYNFGGDSWSTSIVLSSTSIFETTPPASTTLTLSPTSIAIIAGLLVAIIVPIVIVGALYFRKQKKSASAKEDSGQFGLQNPYQSPAGYTPNPYYYDHPYYRKPVGVSPYKPTKPFPKTTYDATIYQRPPSNYVRPGTSTRKCPNCQQIVAATETYCPNCNKKLW